jgi:hypothetical protein
MAILGGGSTIKSIRLLQDIKTKIEVKALIMLKKFILDPLSSLAVAYSSSVRLMIVWHKNARRAKVVSIVLRLRCHAQRIKFKWLSRKNRATMLTG